MCPEGEVCSELCTNVLTIMLIVTSFLSAALERLKREIILNFADTYICYAQNTRAQTLDAFLFSKKHFRYLDEPIFIVKYLQSTTMVHTK